MKNDIPKMSQLMQILKPVKSCGFMDMCANYLADIKNAYERGDAHYEIIGLNTRSGCPETFEFYDNQ